MAFSYLPLSPLYLLGGRGCSWALRLIRLIRLIVLALGLGLGMTVTSAQTYRMSCQLEGVIPSLEDLKMPPAQVTFELQNFGANLFLKIIGPKPYATFFNTLDTDKLEGRNLSSPKALLLRSKHRITGQETEVRIERQTAAVSGHMDIMHKGAMVRMDLKGKCSP